MNDWTERLKSFEQGLDPTRLDRSTLPAQVLGYGEISTVFSIGSRWEGATAGGEKRSPDLACKRMPLFAHRGSAENYEIKYRTYCGLLTEAGLVLPEHTTQIVELPYRPTVFYILQQKLPPERFCHRLLHSLDVTEIRQVLERVAREVDKVWQFNDAHSPGLELALDGQLSNWVLMGDADGGLMSYVDTSTPLYRVNGVEQLDPELFLKSVPSFLRWIIRRLFLEDVMNRYYNQRNVLIDLAANLYKEQRPDLVPSAVEIMNDTLGENVEPLTQEEVKKYYREDKLIWIVFLTSRRFDRWIKTKVLRQRYEFILPGKIKR
ncbi:MAG: DUF6206 family protein [Fidelibacterota bacterium]